MSSGRGYMFSGWDYFGTGSEVGGARWVIDPVDGAKCPVGGARLVRDPVGGAICPMGERTLVLAVKWAGLEGSDVQWTGLYLQWAGALWCCSELGKARLVQWVELKGSEVQWAGLHVQWAGLRWPRGGRG